jgi:hypothetical protein
MDEMAIEIRAQGFLSGRCPLGDGVVKTESGDDSVCQARLLQCELLVCSFRSTWIPKKAASSPSSVRSEFSRKLWVYVVDATLQDGKNG